MFGAICRLRLTLAAEQDPVRPGTFSATSVFTWLPMAAVELRRSAEPVKTAGDLSGGSPWT